MSGAPLNVWLWWRTRLLVGWGLKRLGSSLLDAGWAIINRAAMDYERQTKERHEP